MPPKPRITREMILEAAFAIVREQGAEQISARAVGERLGCSTQPVLYCFARMEDLRAEVYRMADEYQTARLMQLPTDQNPMLAIGLNYVRFAAEEKLLFRFLCQSDSFRGQSIATLTDAPAMQPMLEILHREAGITLQQARTVFRTLVMLVHGVASLLANNTMVYDESEIIPMLNAAFNGMICAMKKEDVP